MFALVHRSRVFESLFMKISKLFHWLYALIMFLPVFFWIPTAFYYGFNEHASAQEKTVQVPIYYDTNEVNNETDLISGNIYKWIDNFSLQVDERNKQYFAISITNEIKSLFANYDDNANRCVMEAGGSNMILYLYENNTALTYATVTDKSFNFVLESIYNTPSENILNSITESNQLLIKDYTEQSYTQSITDSMNNSWQDVWSLPMFSWTHDTFFSAPFNYIAGLFGIQAGNTLSYCLSYWFSISIIWLVFDLMIYVPLLVHRWLDKAAIE